MPDIHGDVSSSPAGLSSPASMIGILMADIHYREYKILLRPERLFNPHQFEVCWNRVGAIAAALNVGVVASKDGFKRRVREVLFYDTPGHDLYRNAFILRKRTFYNDGWADPDHELTLKFRLADHQAAAKANIVSRLHRTADIKFKEELLPLQEGVGGMRSLFSHNCVLLSPDLVLNQGLDRIAAVFPILADHFPSSDGARMALVNNLSVEEVQVNCGSFDFGHGLVAKASIAVWRDRSTQTPIVGEFAFQAKFDRYDALHAKAIARSEAFFKAVQTQAQDWVQLGATKTALVYAFAAPLVPARK